jgi:hypothetical protein
VPVGGACASCSSFASIWAILSPVLCNASRGTHSQHKLETNKEMGEGGGSNDRGPCSLPYLERVIGTLLSKLSVVGRPTSLCWWCCSVACWGTRREVEPVWASRGA